MGFLDKVQDSLNQGQQKLDAVQNKRALDAQLVNLGKWVYATRTGQDGGRGDAEIEIALHQITTMVGQYGMFDLPFATPGAAGGAGPGASEPEPPRGQAAPMPGGFAPQGAAPAPPAQGAPPASGPPPAFDSPPTYETPPAFDAAPSGMSGPPPSGMSGPPPSGGVPPSAAPPVTVDPSAPGGVVPGTPPHGDPEHDAGEAPAEEGRAPAGPPPGFGGPPPGTSPS